MHFEAPHLESLSDKQSRLGFDPYLNMGLVWLYILGGVVLGLVFLPSAIDIFVLLIVPLILGFLVFKQRVNKYWLDRLALQKHFKKISVRKRGLKNKIWKFRCR